MKPLLLLIFLSPLSFSQSLNFISIKTFPPELEISGFLPIEKFLYAVSDNRYDVFLYDLRPENKKEPMQAQKDLTKLEGFWPYYLSSLLWKQNGRWIKSPWDLEGGAVCGSDYYLANEQVRDVIKVSSNKLESLELDLDSAYKNLGTPIEKTAVNAGLEGVAVDCKRGVLYIAQERGPRGIFAFNLVDGSFLRLIQTNAKNNPNPDYADLYFEKDHLYALERNQRKILKLSSNGKLIDAKSYEALSADLMTKELYETGKPFGLAEALYMNKDFIYLGLDNNGNVFSEKAKAKLGLEKAKNESSLLTFKRPKGF